MPLTCGANIVKITKVIKPGTLPQNETDHTVPIANSCQHFFNTIVHHQLLKHNIGHHVGDSINHECSSPDDCHYTISSSDHTGKLLFLTFYNTNYSLKDKVSISLERLSNNYFVDWSSYKLKHVADYLRPIVPITKLTWKNELYNRYLKFDVSLQIIMRCNQEWAGPFKSMLDDLLGEHNCFKSLCEVKSHAYVMCKRHAPKTLSANIRNLSIMCLPLASVENQPYNYTKK